MNERDLIQSLRTHRDDARLGAMTDAQSARVRSALLQKMGVDEADFVPGRYGWKDYVDYYFDGFRHAVLRPAMVGVGMLALVVGGWMTSVSAAYESVPGDFFYPIKIATEQAQLTIAISDQKRAELHMEFASRRLAEVSSISASGSSDADKQSRMKTAVVAFKNEVAEAKTVMQNMEGSEEVAAVASALDTKAGEYADAIDQTTQSLGAAVNVTDDVASAKVDAEQAGTDAVEVMVHTVEVTPEKSNVAEDLQKSFQADLVDIDNQVKLTLGRIAVIQHVVENGSFMLPPSTDLRVMSNQLERVSTETHSAATILAQGGYRTAFEQLAEVQGMIDTIDAQVVQLELSIVAQRDGTVDLPPIE